MTTDPNANARTTTLSESEFFWSRVRKDDCWIWLGYTNPNGYGEFHYRRRRQMAHRYAYGQLVGPIPAGLHIDHLCRTHACVNPAHMEPVTIAENVLRGVGFSAKNAKKTHCPSGHPYSGENLYVDRHGYRYCKACNRINRAKCYARVAEAKRNRAGEGT